MRTQPIHDKLHALGLRGLTEAFREQQESAACGMRGCKTRP